MSLLSKTIVGIDIHDYSIELVELVRKGNDICFEAYNRVVIPSDIIVDGSFAEGKIEDLKEHLTTLLEKSNPKPVEAKNVALIVPSNKVLTHIFSFPANLTEKEIAKALPYEIETVIPFPITDIYYDYTILEKEQVAEKHASQYVLFAGIPRTAADRYTGVLESVGLTPSIFGITAEALRYALPSDELKKKTALIIDVDVLSVNYLVVKNGVIKYYFSANEGGHSFVSNLSDEINVPEDEIIEKKERNAFGELSAADQSERFMRENFERGKSIILDQEKKGYIGKIGAVMLTGKYLNVQNYDQLAKECFPGKEVTTEEPQLSLSCLDQDFEVEEKEEYVPYSVYFTNAIGIAIRGLTGSASSGINLLPDRLKESFTYKRISLFSAIAAIIMTAIILFLAVGLSFSYQNEKYERMRLEVQKSSIENLIYGTRYQEIRDQIQEFNTEVSALAKIDQGLISVPAILNDIYTLIPSGVKLTSFQFTDTDLSLEINGIATTREDLLETQKNLEDANFIQEVIAPISNFDEKSQLSFLIKITFNQSKLSRYGTTSDS